MNDKLIKCRVRLDIKKEVDVKQILGLILIVSGVLIGLYVGLWVMFVGGIIQVIQNVTPTISAIGIALGILRIMCSSAIGWLCFVILISLGKNMLD